MPANSLQARYITDPSGRRTHVILPMELYQRIIPLRDSDDLTVAEACVAQERVAATDWDVPAMDACDDR